MIDLQHFLEKIISEFNMYENTGTQKLTMDINACPICLSNPLDNLDNDISWIQCDKCSQWFHNVCLKIRLSEVQDIISYHCENCTKKHGPSTCRRKSKRSKPEIDYIALNEGDAFAVDKSTHPHVSSFLKFESEVDRNDSKNCPFVHISDSLDKELAFTTGLKKPILIPVADTTKVGLSLPISREQISIDYITQKVGEDQPVEVMDVLSQQGVKPGWNMEQWNKYFHLDESSRDRIRNVISLEISDVDELGKSFIRPKMVRELDLVDKVWKQQENERPKVTTYCLMSVNKSFTDFHIDFGGTSVYYNICSGSKTFLMFPPSDENLTLYTSWCLEPDQNFLWFPNYTKSINGKKRSPLNGFKVKLEAGDLFIIPSGWIHSVYTHEDSIVIGGNFLTLMDMETQLKINEIEKNTNVPAKFRFPYFNKVIWLTAWYYMTHKELFINDLPQCHPIKTENEQPRETIQIKVVRSLLEHLKSHFQLSKTNNIAKKTIPSNLIGKDTPAFLTQLESWLQDLEQSII